MRPPTIAPAAREVPLIALAALLWLPGLGGESFLSDDVDHLTTWGQPPFAEIWRWFYSESFRYYRPLTALLWKLEFAAWGFAPLGYQVVNIALHAACALQVRAIARQLAPGSAHAGLWSGLVFLFLPGHIFGVLMISALTGLLCALFYLTAAVCYLRARGTGSAWRQAPGPAFFLLALLTKELALSLPLLIGLWEGLALRGEKRLTPTRWLRACLPYGLVGLGYLAFRYALFGHLPYSELHANPTPTRLLVNAATYAAKGFAPWGLEGLKPFFRAHPLWLLAAGGAGLLAALGALWRWRRALPRGAVYGLVWFAVAALPVVSLYSPWNTYLPAAGAALALGAFGQGRAKRAALAAFLALSILYSLGHQRHWQQARALCAEVVAAAAQLEPATPVYLANLPAEWNEVPLFISDWALRGALAWRGQGREITALANVVKTQRDEALDIRPVSDTRLALRLLAPGDFFRLESMEVLAGAQAPAVGYTYRKGDLLIRVAGLGAQGQPNALEVDLGSADRLARVHYWDGQHLVRLGDAP